MGEPVIVKGSFGLGPLTSDEDGESSASASWVTGIDSVERALEAMRDHDCAGLELREVRVGHMEARDLAEGLANITGPSLLRLIECPGFDKKAVAELETLEELGDLRRLDLRGCPDLNAGLETLPVTIEALSLAGCTKLKAPTIAKIGCAESLRWLDLEGVATDTGLKKLSSSLEAVEWLDISSGPGRAPLTGAGVSALIGCGSLTVLAARGGWGRGVVRALAKLPRLRVLDASDGWLSDYRPQDIGKLHSLRRLRVRGMRTSLERRIVDAIGTLPELVELDVTGTRVDERGMRAFLEAHPQCAVIGLPERLKPRKAPERMPRRELPTVDVVLPLLRTLYSLSEMPDPDGRRGMVPIVERDDATVTQLSTTATPAQLVRTLEDEDASVDERCLALTLISTAVDGVGRPTPEELEAIVACLSDGRDTRVRFEGVGVHAQMSVGQLACAALLNLGKQMSKGDRAKAALTATEILPRAVARAAHNPGPHQARRLIAHVSTWVRRRADAESVVEAIAEALAGEALDRTHPAEARWQAAGLLQRHARPDKGPWRISEPFARAWTAALDGILQELHSGDGDVRFRRAAETKLVSLAPERTEELRGVGVFEARELPAMDELGAGADEVLMRHAAHASRDDVLTALRTPDHPRCASAAMLAAVLVSADGQGEGDAEILDALADLASADGEGLEPGAVTDRRDPRALAAVSLLRPTGVGEAQIQRWLRVWGSAIRRGIRAGLRGGGVGAVAGTAAAALGRFRAGQAPFQDAVLAMVIDGDEPWPVRYAAALHRRRTDVDEACVAIVGDDDEPIELRSLLMQELLDRRSKLAQPLMQWFDTSQSPWTLSAEAPRGLAQTRPDENVPTACLISALVSLPHPWRGQALLVLLRRSGGDGTLEDLRRQARRLVEWTTPEILDALRDCLDDGHVGPAAAKWLALLGSTADATRLVDAAVRSGAVRGSVDQPEDDLSRLVNTVRRPDTGTYSPLEPHLIVGFGSDHAAHLSASILARQAEAAIDDEELDRARRLLALARDKDPDNLDVQRAAKRLK